MVSFPHDFLSAQTLEATLKMMQQKQRYQQILFYLESCESGSMFQDLPGDISVLAFTASNATAPSFACYYDPGLETFLADVFSISWLDDSDSKDHQTERVWDQIEAVANKTSSFSVSSVYGNNVYYIGPRGTTTDQEPFQETKTSRRSWLVCSRETEQSVETERSQGIFCSPTRSSLTRCRWPGFSSTKRRTKGRSRLCCKKDRK